MTKNVNYYRGIAVVLSKTTNFAVDIANYELSRQVDYCFGLMPVF